jgi:hypothetical protein
LHTYRHDIHGVQIEQIPIPLIKRTARLIKMHVFSCLAVQFF